MSVKKVFAIIGIVVGCVAAFVGGVFGVMAAMGKFKTPVVKPEKLYFETPEQVIVAEYYDKDKNDVLYSFTLVGENDSVDHPVNVKDCYIWFEDDIGEDLIELCDKDGRPLQYDSQKRYTIQCNEKVYYKIKAQYYVYEYVDAEKWNSDRAGLYVLDDGKYVVNKSENYDENVTYYTRRTFEENNPTLDLTSETNGKVVLRARTVDNTSAQTNQDLVIWVDRKVTSIFLDYGEEINPTNQKEQQQTINIGKDYELEFGYVVNPELAWQPISKESKKIVELYYDDEKTEDFVLVTPENIKNKTAYSLYKIFDETKSYTDETTGEMKLTFRAGETTSNGAPHVFKLAIFSSYNARAEFLERDRLTLLETGMSIQNSERLEFMVVTNLKVNVINSNIDEVTMSDESLNLGLYSNNTMYLNNASADNNLGVEMSIGGYPTDIRMHEVDFKNFDVNFDGLSPKFEIFISQTGVIGEFDFKDYEILYNGDYLRLTNKFDSSVLEFTVNKTIKIGDYDVINSLENADGTYHCINGVALLKDADDSYQHIIPNSYLNFYVYNVATGSYELAKETDIKYTIEKDESYVKHADAKWNITVESVNESVKGNLVLGLLVANNDARFDVTKLFAKKVVNVSVDALIVNTVNGSATLDLIAEHNVDDNTIKYSYVDSSEKDFDYFIQVAKGTYDACVFVISEDDLSKSIVEYTNIYYQNPYDSKKYYIVGYFNESNLFVNNIRTINNEEATKDSEIVLTMLQLKNNYKETAEAMINNRLLAAPGNPEEPIQLDSVFVEALKGETITIRQNLLLDESIKFITTVDEATNPVDNPDKLYSETPNHTLTVTSETEGIVDKIVNFYGINIDSINNQPIVNNVSYYIINDKLTNVEIKNVNNASNVLTLTFDIFGTVYSGENVNIGLANMFADGDIESLYSFKIESSAPEKIVFYYDTDKKIELVEEGYTPPQVKAKITWNGSNYVTTWYYGTDELGTTFELNKQFSIATSGFQDGEGFKVGHPIEYNITGNSVVIDKASEPNILNVVGAGQATLAVLVSGVTRYLDIVVDTSLFDIVKTGNSNILEDTIVGAIDGATGWLRNYIDYTYEGTEIYYAATALSDVKLSDFTPTYGGGNLTVAETADSITFTNSKPEMVLKIERVSTASGYDWKFTRTSDFNARLSITFKVKTLTTSKTCRIDFEADVMHDVNSAAWGTDPVLYQGTTIKLYEKSNYGAGGYNFEYQPLIQIMDKTGGNTVKFYEKGKGPDTTSPELLGDNKKLDTIGKFEFDIWVEKGTEKILIAPYSFDVVPNIVAKQTETGPFELSSGKDVTDEFFNKVKLYQYKTKLEALDGGTDIVYGATKDELGRVVVYSTENAVVDNTNPASPTTESVLEDKTNALKSQVGVTSIEEKSEGKPWVKTVSNVITSEWIENVGAMQEVNLDVSTTSGNIIGTFEAVVKNSYKVTTNADNIKDKTLNIMAMKDIAAMFNINATGFSLKSIKWTYSDDNSNDSKGPYEVSEGKLKIPANAIPANAGSYNNVSLILIFTDGSKELIFAGTNINDIQDLKINIIPFELTTLANIEAYSGEDEEFNLLTGVYDTTDITNYTSIEVMSVTDKKGNSLTGSQLGVAYTSTHNSGLTITFNDIVGDRVQAFIKYNVIYNDGTTREYSKEITLWNWQDVIPTYPEQHDSLKTAEDLTLNGGSLDAGERFEAVLIDNDDSFVLNLLNDDIKHIKRITAKDRKTGNSSDVEIEDLYVLANTDSLDINRYVQGNNISIEKQTGTITFGSYGISFEGFVVFEMVLSSGNIEKYVVWLTSKGSEINYCSASKTATKCGTGSAIATGTEINLESLVDDDYLENTFKVEDGSKVKMFLLKATTLNPNDIDDEVDFNLGSQYSCVDGKTAKINDYTTITLSLVYDAEDTYPVGILTLVLRPSGAITTIAGFGPEDAGIEDGKFTKVLDANATSEGYPTDDFAVTSIVQENSSVVTNDGSNLVISQRVDKDYTFTVFYKHSADGYTIKVAYTLPKVNIKQGTEITVGDFDKETNEFNTTLEINKNNYLQLFGYYKGRITIGSTTFTVSGDYVFAPVSPAGTTGTITTGINYEVVGGVLKLTFTQYLYDESKTIDVSYNNLYASESIKQYTFTVKSGVYIEEVGAGTEEFNRKETTPTNNYTSDIGSTLSVDKSGTSVAKYEVAGYTIYINNASGKLEFTFAESDSPYVLNDDDTTFKLLSGGGTINFTHTAAPRDINVEIRILENGTDRYFKVDEATVLVKNLYLTIAKTYEDVEAVYIAKSATIDEQTYKVEAENVVKGRVINDLREYFFTAGNGGKIYTVYIYTDDANWLANKENLFVYNSDTKSYVKTTDAAYDSSKTYYSEVNNFDGAVANQIKLKLIDVDGIERTIDFSDMGFTTNGNPNYIRFESTSGLALITDNKITFSSEISENTLCNINLSNDAGMSCTYSFQIMKDAVEDGISYANAGFAGDKSGDEKIDYMSFVIEDNIAEVDFTTGKLKIGTISDGRAKGVYVYVDIAGDLTTGPEWKFLPRNSVMENIIHGSNFYNLTLESSGDLYIEYHRGAGARLNEITEIVLNVHGTTAYIVKDFNIVLFNMTVGPVKETVTIIYSGDSKAYGELINMPTEEGSITSVDVELNTKNSGFKLHGQGGDYTSLTANDDILQANNAAEIITTNIVGEDLDMKLIFTIKINGYFINDVECLILLKRSVQFVFNGDTAEKDEDGEIKILDRYAFETNFVLTNVNGANVSKFSDVNGIEIGFGALLDADAKKLVDGIYYYSQLIWKLEKRKTTELSVDFAIDSSKHTNGLIDGVTLDNVNKKLVFKKDYTGDINLVLTVTLTSGFDYVVNWKIKVFGILHAQQQNKTEYDYLLNSGNLFNSGEDVALLNGSTAAGTGIFLKDMTGVFNTIEYWDREESGKKVIDNITYQYAIVENSNNNDKTNAQRFEAADEANKSEVFGDGLKADGETTDGDDDKNVLDRVLNVALPIVPHGKEYRVIYKVVISYLGDVQTYFVTYLVKNNVGISVAEPEDNNHQKFDADNINVNERLVNSHGVKSLTASDNKHLDLFYYSQTYENSGNKYKYTYDGSLIQISKVEGVDPSPSSVGLDGWTAYKNTEIPEYEPKEAKYEWVKKDAYNKITNSSVFRLNCGSIYDFGKFIESVGKVIIKTSTTEFKFDLVHIADGRWGIDLTNRTVSPADADNTVLFNNKLEDAQLIIQATNGQTIYSIDKYNESADTGFRMYTSNQLVAAGSQNFGDLFNPESITTGDWNDYKDINIAGVYTGTFNASNNWIKYQNSNDRTGIAVKENPQPVSGITIEVATGTATDIEYTLQTVVYKGSGGLTGICAVEDTFHIVYGATKDAIYRFALAKESAVKYTQGQNTQVSLNDFLYKFKNAESGKLVIDTNVTDYSLKYKSGDEIHKVPVGTEITNTKIITIAETDLIGYKNQYPNKTYATVVYDATFDSIQLQISINYSLPALPSKHINKSDLETSTEININSDIYVLNAADGNYVELSGELNNVTNIKENASNYTSEFKKDTTTGKYTGVINLNKNAVDEYFTTTGKNILNIKYTITTNLGDLTFEIVVKNS